jgi:hypothetical protein
MLIYCPACNSLISKHARSCDKCNHPFSFDCRISGPPLYEVSLSTIGGHGYSQRHRLVGYFCKYSGRLAYCEIEENVSGRGNLDFARWQFSRLLPNNKDVELCELMDCRITTLCYCHKCNWLASITSVAVDSNGFLSQLCPKCFPHYQLNYITYCPRGHYTTTFVSTLRTHARPTKPS